MVYVILRDGRKLHYNDGGAVSVENGTITIRPKSKKYLIARLPLDVVERVEYNAPCRITWEQKPKKKKH